MDEILAVIAPYPAFVGLRVFAPNIQCSLMPLADDLMYIWTTSNEPDASWKEESQLPMEMHSIVSEVGGIYGEMRDKYLVEGAEVMYRPFEYIDLPRPWHKGSVVLIGDAAHASTAHLAQGGTGDG